MENKPKYINLKEAAEISGYAPDYIGQLIRKGKLSGKQVYCNVAWVTTEEAVREYLAKHKLEGNVQNRTLNKFGYLLKAFKISVYSAFILALGLSLLLFHVLSVSIDKKIQDKVIKKHAQYSFPDSLPQNSPP